MYTKMITSFVNILIVINFVHGIYNGISIPNPSNKMIKFPWMIRIAIFFEFEDNENVSPLINDFFGGTLITSTHILTVAHPFKKSDEVDGFKKPYQGIAYAGVYSKSEIPDPENCMQQSERARAEVGNPNCRVNYSFFQNSVLIKITACKLCTREMF